MKSIVAKTKAETLKGKNRKRLIFYIALLAFPVAHFCVFYIGVNFNSILLSFRRYDLIEGYSFVGFNTFKDVFTLFRETSYLRDAISNSLIAYFYSFVVGLTLSIIFSYYIFKKLPMSGLFKVVLYLPQVLSSVVMAIIFLYFAEDAIPEIVERITGSQIRGILFNDDVNKTTVIAYSIWMGFGIQVLLYLGAMNGISESIIESAELDGCGPVRELWNIVIPMIFPTITTFIVVGIAGIFVNQLHLFSFFGGGAQQYHLYTIGYYLYSSIQSPSTTLTRYPELAATGLLFTLVTVPTTLIVRRILIKFGPSTN